VVHRFQGDRSGEFGVDFAEDLPFGDGCIDASSCLFAEQQLPAEMRSFCVYADYTLASTGVIPPAGDCDALASEGLCSIDCPCQADGVFTDCFGLSEVQSVGVCAAPPYCVDALPCGGGQSCVRAVAHPEWADDIESAIPGGRCAPAAACAALVARAPGTWSCGSAR
jgi:hypothetical protein